MLDWIARFPRLSVHFVFILEAHSTDEWPVSGRWRVAQHRTIRERIEQAGKYFRETLKIQQASGSKFTLADSRFHFYSDILPRSEENRKKIFQEYSEWKQNRPETETVPDDSARSLELLADRVFLAASKDSSVVPASLIESSREINPFNQDYRAWPLRAYLLDSNLSMKFVSSPSDEGEFLIEPFNEAIQKVHQTAG